MARTRTSISRGFRGFAAAATLALLGLSAACNRSPQAKEAAYLRRGEALLAKKDYSRALLEFKSAAAAMPKDAEPYYQLGLTFLAEGDMGRGVAALRRATALNPKHERAQLKLGELMATSARKEVLQQAASVLEGVLSASPENSEANDALALAEWKLGKTEEAASRLEETLRKFPSRLGTSVELARLKLGHKDLAGAEAVLKQAVASAPESSAAELALGQIYMLGNQPAKAGSRAAKSHSTGFEKRAGADGPGRHPGSGQPHGGGRRDLPPGGGASRRPIQAGARSVPLQAGEAGCRVGRV